MIVFHQNLVHIERANQNQALLDMFHVLRNEEHYFLHIFFRLNLREANFPRYLDHMPRAS